MVETLGLQIRDAAVSDLPAMEWEGEYRRYRRVYRQAMKEAEKGRRIILVAEIGDFVVGQIFIHFHTKWSFRFKDRKTGFLHSFRVRENYRKQGIGTKLIQSAEAELLEQRFRRAAIAVGKDNADALRLYQELGYKVFTEDPGRWSYTDNEGQLQQIAEPSWVLEKWLS